MLFDWLLHVLVFGVIWTCCVAFWLCVILGFAFVVSLYLDFAVSFGWCFDVDVWLFGGFVSDT